MSDWKLRKLLPSEVMRMSNYCVLALFLCSDDIASIYIQQVQSQVAEGIEAGLRTDVDSNQSQITANDSDILALEIKAN